MADLRSTLLTRMTPRAMSQVPFSIFDSSILCAADVRRRFRVFSVSRQGTFVLFSRVC